MESARSRLPIVAIILVLGFLVHARSLAYGFVFDEHILISENPAVTDFRVDLIFGSKFWPGPTQGVYYRPLVTLSYAVGYALAGPAPWVQHLMNVGFHLAACVLVYLLLIRLCGRPGLAAVSALVFAVHPIHAESVDWAPGRTDVLAVIFVCLAWLLLFRARDREGRAARIALIVAAMLAYLCGLGSKEAALALPALVIAYDLIFKGRGAGRQIPEYAAFIVVTAAFLALRAHLLSGPGEPPAPCSLAGLGLSDRALMTVFIFANAFRVLLFPHPHRIDYAYEETMLTAPTWTLALSAIAVIGLLLAAALSIKKSRLLAFAVISIFISMLPMSHLISFPTLFAERFMYLPSLFVALLIGLLIEAAGIEVRKAPAKRTRAYVFQAAFAALIVVMALMSVSRARGFSDMIGYWRSAVSQTEKPVARNLLGVAYRNQGRYQEAMRQYERAFRLDPDFTVARMNQAEIWLRKKKYEDAARILEELALTGDLSPALIKNLDYAYSFQGGWEARTKKWKREIEQNPESVDARLLLALYYLEVRGDERAARAQLEAAGRTDPQHPLVRALSPGPPGKGDGSVSAP